jgi:hypothetical protein
MLDCVSLAEMTGIFDANLNGADRVADRVDDGLSPAVQFSRDEYFRVDGLLAYACSSPLAISVPSRARRSAA